MSFFSPESSNTGSTSFDLIPAGTLAKVVVIVKEIKLSQATGAKVIDLELVIDGGKYDRRRVYGVICDPWDLKTSEKGKEMAVGTITRIMEYIGVFDPANPESYNAFNSAGIEEVAMAINTKTAGIVIGIKKGSNGYSDRNEVKEWQSPNPKSNGFKSFSAAQAGKETMAAPSEAAATVLAPKPQPVAAAAPPWMKAK
jgi:hypothetical protein